MVNKYTYKPPCSKECLAEMYETKTQSQCGVELGVSQKVIFNAMRHFGIKARKASPRNQTRENNNNWKANKAGKQAFHRRLYAKHGKPYACSVCGTSSKQRSYDYANLSGEYENENDYAAMCRSCHWKYDEKIRNIKHMNDKMNGGSHA